jgi:hypothetical protein
MTAPPDDIPVLRFSTDELPECDRLAVTREVFGRLTTRLDIEPAPDVPVHCRTVARLLPELNISTFSISANTARRTRELLADSNDDVVLALSSTAGNIVSQVGRELVHCVGDAVPFSNADLAVIKTFSMPHCLNLSLRRRLLAGMVQGLEDRFLRPIPSENEALQLLTSYVRLFAHQQELATPELRHHVVSHVYDLAALALGGTRDAVAIANGRGLRAARLHAIKTKSSTACTVATCRSPALRCAMVSARATCKCCSRATERRSRGFCSTGVWRARVAC